MTTLNQLAPKLLQAVDEAQEAIFGYQSEINRYAMLENLFFILFDADLIKAIAEVKEAQNSSSDTTSKDWPESSNIAKTEYEPQNSVLIVTFKNNLKYGYQDFPSDKWAELLKTESIGKYINGCVKGIYTSQKLETVNSL